MGVGESIGDLNGYRKGAFEFQRPAGDELAHILALNVLHRNIKEAVGLVKIIYGADIRMIELGAELGLTFKSFEICRFLSEFGRKYLDDNRSVEFCI